MYGLAKLVWVKLGRLGYSNRGNVDNKVTALRVRMPGSCCMTSYCLFLLDFESFVDIRMVGIPMHGTELPTLSCNFLSLIISISCHEVWLVGVVALCIELPASYLVV
jgi:hypothetical protein